jgi:hypothetical protein
MLGRDFLFFIMQSYLSLLRIVKKFSYYNNGACCGRER